MQASKSIQPPRFLDEVISANNFSSSLFGLPKLVARSDHGNFLRFPETVGQDNRSTHHLVCMLGIDTKAHVYFDGLVELRVMDLFESAHRVFNRIRRSSICFFAASYFLPAFAITPPQFPCCAPSLSQSGLRLRDWPRSDPAASIAQCLQLVSCVTVPTLLLFGSPDPFAMFAARLRQDRSRRGLGNKTVRTIGVDRHNDRNDQTFLVLADVFALNALQKSMIVTPCWPSAGPTGGAGVALPAVSAVLPGL